MDCSLPGSSVFGILQARMMEWVAMPSSRGSFWSRNQTWESYYSCIGRFFTTCHCCSVVQSYANLSDPMNCSISVFHLFHYLLEFAQTHVHWADDAHPTISSSVTPFSFCPQSFSASGSFPMSQLFASGGQSIGASAPVLPMNIQGWFPLGLTGLISLLSKGLSRVFSSTTV